MKRGFLLLPLLLAVGAAALARPYPPATETPTPEALPKPPLMAGAGADAEWTVNYELKNTDKEASTPEAIRNRKMRERYSPLVLEKRFLKGNGQTVIYTIYEAGLRSESWVVGKYVYELLAREGEALRINPKPASDFPEIDWVKAANFRGTVTQQSRKVYLYEADATDPTPAPGAEPPAKAQPRRAYIDIETRRPMMAETGEATWTYHFFEAPSTLPAMDERIARQLKSPNE